MERKNKSLMWKNILHVIIKNPLVIIFGIAAVGFSLSNKAFASTANLINLTRQLSIIGMVSVGETFVMIGGGFDLSAGSVTCLSAVVVAALMNFGWFPAIFAGLLTAIAIGCINGVLIAKANVNPFVVTLGMMAIARGFCFVITGGAVISYLADWYVIIGNSKILGIHTPIFIFMLVIIIGFIVLRYTLFGRYVYSIGGNFEASNFSGIRADRYLIFTYIICSFLSGLAGIILASRLDSVSPLMADGYELAAIAAVIVGGTRLGGGAGSVLGSILGVFIIGIIGNGLLILNIDPYWQDIFKGAVIIIAVAIDVYRKKKSAS